MSARGGPAPGIDADLLRRYDRPGPRYTSYPTAVEFSEEFTERHYLERLAMAASVPHEPLSLYCHIPFCEERCSFCGCMVVITRRRDVASRYLAALMREIELVAPLLGGRRTLTQLHWGGGTPTYLEPDQMRALHAVIARHFTVAPGAEVAIEVDPRVTTLEQIDLLRELGFNRLSMGIQDFDPVTQEAVHRVQPEEMTRGLFDYCRKAGFASINIDLIYGLPFQTPQTFGRTLEAVIAMRPDRVAAYSYAHVPWIRGNQKRIDPNDLPARDVKFELLLMSMERFDAAGYRTLGMDHYALPGDELALASEAGVLHRNFMGYTTRPAPDQIGTGLSAIGDVRDAFAQNTKKMSTYFATVESGHLPVERGFVLDADDRVRRHAITQLMCNFRLEREDLRRRFGVDLFEYFGPELERLRAPGEPAAEGLLTIDDDGLRASPAGRLLIRNICMAFDRYLAAKDAKRPVFSRTI